MAVLRRKTSSFLKERELRKGFTLIEVVIVVAIIAVLILISIYAFQKQMARGRDARRKADLNRLEKVFEDYYNDHDCYPETINQIVPDYLSEFPKDPGTREPYEWSVDGCDIYRIYANLDWRQDPVIAEIGCSSGCGPKAGTAEGICTCNYGVCSSNAELENCASCSFGCQGENCNNISGNFCDEKDPPCWDCPQRFCSVYCEDKCGDSAYQCKWRID